MSAKSLQAFDLFARRSPRATNPTEKPNVSTLIVGMISAAAVTLSADAFVQQPKFGSASEAKLMEDRGW